MFKTLKDKIIEEFTQKGQKLIITNGFYRLEDFHEVSANRESIPLGNNILLLKKISVFGQFNTSTFDATKNFFEVESSGNSIDYTHMFEVSGMPNNRMIISSEFPSIHNTFLKVNYELANFLESNAANLYRGALEYLMFHPVD